MSSQSSSKLKSLYDSVRGYEPPPPIGDYEVPPSKSDKRQMYAMIACCLFVAALAFSVVYFNILGIHFREIPDNVLNPFSPLTTVATPTAAP